MKRGLCIVLGLVLGLLISTNSHAASPVRTDPSLQYKRTLIRETHAVYGLNGPVPAFAGQIRQESNWRADVTAWDNGRGLAQFMDGTSKLVSTAYPELGAPQPYNPEWAIRALVRFNQWNYKRVKGDTECERWAASFKGYNAGVGYVQRAQKKSPTPGLWFGATEMINGGQSEQNFEHSRIYPRIILFTHQKLYRDWGTPMCDIDHPPPGKLTYK